MQRSGVRAQITFLYYCEMELVSPFYEEVMGLELVQDQGWAKVYHVGGSAYLGVVTGEKGLKVPQEENAVLVTLVVDDVAEWYDGLQGKGIKLLSGLEHREEIGIRRFYLEDPGGYALEVQQFLNPRQIEFFGG